MNWFRFFTLLAICWPTFANAKLDRNHRILALSQNGGIASGLGSNGGDLPAFWYDGVSVGNFANTANWQEISGMAYSTTPANANYLWIISDSPANMLAAVSITNASNQGVWTLSGISIAAPSDWEDISSAKIGSQSYLYVADIGDNPSTRGTFNIFRIKEPTITGSDGTIAAGNIETIVCAYPAGNLPTLKDAEALIVDPATGDMRVLTKREAISGVYLLAHQTSYTGTQTLVYEGKMFDIPDITTVALGATACNVTAACISPNGKEILVRNYNDVYRFARNPPTQTIYQALAGTPVLADSFVGGGSTTIKKSHPSQEPQGESICFDVNGRNYYTSSEYVASEGSTATQYPLFKYVRAPGTPRILTFQDGVSPTAGYTGTLDTYIWDTNPAIDNGAATSIIADTAVTVETDQRKGLLRFDLSSIPTTSTVLGSRLDLFINTEGQGWKFHKMLVTWVESSTYNSLVGGVDNDGVEAAIAEESRNGFNLDTITGSVRNNISFATVQSWITTPASNFGWLIEATDLLTGDGEQFDSRNGVTAANRPKLTVRVYP